MNYHNREGGLEVGSINERLKEARKYLKLSQKTVAEKIGTSQSNLSWSETPGNNVSDVTIKSFCAVFHVSEKWLRTGAGPMMIKEDIFSLDHLIQEAHATDLEIEILKAYFELDYDVRQGILNYFKDKFAHLTNLSSSSDSSIVNSCPSNPEQLEKEYSNDNNQQAI